MKYDKCYMLNFCAYDLGQFSKYEFTFKDQEVTMKRWSTLRSFLICGMGLVSAACFLMAPFTVNASEQRVRLSIPACMF